MHSIAFRKMHGAGNDFIGVRDDDGSFPDRDAAGIARLCAPPVGIACVGLVASCLRKQSKSE